MRELENLIHRLVITSDGTVKPEDLKDLTDSKSQTPEEITLDFSEPLPQKVARLEKMMIEEALKRTGYVQTKAAKLLGIDEKSLRYKRRKYGI